MYPVTFLLKHWKILSILGMGFLLFFGGFFYGKQSGLSVQTSTSEETKTQEVEKRQENRNVKTVIVKRKDGTETTTIVENTQIESKTDTKTHSEKQTETTIPTDSFAIGARALVDTSKPLERPDTIISIGYRLWKPIWLRGDYNIQDKDLSVGFDLSF